MGSGSVSVMGREMEGFPSPPKWDEMRSGAGEQMSAGGGILHNSELVLSSPMTPKVRKNLHMHKV